VAVVCASCLCRSNERAQNSGKGEMPAGSLLPRAKDE
jgi:hypothetical protein